MELFKGQLKALKKKLKAVEEEKIEISQQNEKSKMAD